MDNWSDFNNITFTALQVREQEDGKFSSSIIQRKVSELPEGDVLIKVEWSGLNYKDALSASGHKGITRRFPHTPGIDAAGTVAYSTNPAFVQGEQVLVTGYDLGMNTSGGFAQYIRVPGAWVVKLPAGLGLKESMIIGTSGFTAASAIFEFLHHGITPQAGKVLVSGATGAVGSMAVAMLARNGFQVVASSGKPELTDLLLKLGASEVIDRQSIDDASGKGLLPGRWIAALDTVSGNTLSTILRSTIERGIVCNCGMIASSRLDVPVFPFILRAVRLIGIASADTPMNRRLEIWKLISEKLQPANLDEMHRVVGLDAVQDELNRMLSGQQSGKVLVQL